MGNAISDPFANEDGQECSLGGRRSLGDGGSFDWSCYDTQRRIRAVPSPRHDEHSHTRPTQKYRDQRHRHREKRGGSTTASSQKGGKGGERREREREGTTRRSPRTHRNTATNHSSYYDCSAAQLSDYTSRCHRQGSDVREGNNSNKNPSTTTRSIGTRSTSCFGGYEAGDNTSVEGSASQGGGKGRYGRQYRDDTAAAAAEGGYLADGDEISVTSDMAHHGRPRIRPLPVETLHANDGVKDKDEDRERILYETEEEATEEREEQEDEEAVEEEERTAAEEYEEEEEEQEEEEENEVREDSSGDVGKTIECPTEEYDVGDSGTIVENEEEQEFVSDGMLGGGDITDYANEDEDSSGNVGKTIESPTEEYDVGDSGTIVENKEEQEFVSDGMLGGGDITDYANDDEVVVSETEIEVTDVMYDTTMEAEEDGEEEQIPDSEIFSHDEGGDGYEDDAAASHENEEDRVSSVSSSRRSPHSMIKDVEEIVEQLHSLQGSLSMATTKKDVEEIVEQIRSVASPRISGPSTSTKNIQVLEKEERESEIIELVDIDDKVYDQCVERGEEVSSKISSHQNSEKSENRESCIGGAKPTAMLSTEEAKEERYPEISTEYVDRNAKIQSIELDDLYPSFPKFGTNNSSVGGSIRSRLSVVSSFLGSKKSGQSSQKDTAHPDHDDNATRNTRKTLIEVSSVEGSFGTREPAGVKDCGTSVEESLVQMPEEKMAQNILNSRIKQALQLGEKGSGSAVDDEASLVSKRHQEPRGITSGPSPVDEEDLTEVFSDIDGVDIGFIQQYEAAFEAFLQQNLDLMAKNPELVYNLRVAKLQQVLQLLIENEAKLTDNIEIKKKEKDNMVAIYKKQLVEAARRKAALEIHLRQELATIQQATVETKGKLTWQVIMKNNQRAKKHYHMLKRLSREKAAPGQLLRLLPDQPGMEAIHNAASLVEYFSAYERDLQQFQVDNALLKAEVKVLEKKLAYEQAIAKKYAWVDSLLIRMESAHFKKLKSKYQKKLGAQF